jgi:hypothetical protein
LFSLTELILKFPLAQRATKSKLINTTGRETPRAKTVFESSSPFAEALLPLFEEVAVKLGVEESIGEDEGVIETIVEVDVAVALAVPLEDDDAVALVVAVALADALAVAVALGLAASPVIVYIEDEILLGTIKAPERVITGGA